VTFFTKYHNRYVILSIFSCSDCFLRQTQFQELPLLEDAIGPLLNLQNLYGFIDGTSAAPAITIPTSPTDPTPIPNPAYEEWFKKDQLLQSWLLSSLSNEVFPFVMGLKSANDVWQALANPFGSVSHNKQR
jgi:hypothetical protein